MTASRDGATAAIAAVVVGCAVAACAVRRPPVIAPPPVRTPLPTAIGAAHALPEARSLAWVGATYYRHYCTECHGEAGAGDGPGAGLLDPPPTDFTDRAYMRRQTPLWYYRSITDGVVGSSMAPWAPRLRPAERWDAAFYVWSMAVPDAVRSRGAAVYGQACAACHGSDGRGVRAARLDDPRRVALSRDDAAAALARAHPDRVPRAAGDRDALDEHLWTFLYAPVGAAADGAAATPSPPR